MATAETKIQSKIRASKKVSEEKNLDSYLEILEENVSAEQANIKAEQIKLSSEEDLESLLKLAEELKEKVDSLDLEIRSYQRRVISGNLILFLVFFITPLTAYYFLYSLKTEIADNNLLFYAPRLSFITLLILILSNLIWYFFGNTKMPDIKREFASEKLALREVLQLLREVHGTIAEREDWSILKRAEFRIRLSRFDLSEKKESVFNFFS